MSNTWITPLQEGLRQALGEISSESTPTIDSIKQVLSDSLDYLRFEETELFPLLAELEPGLIDAFAQEHRLMNWRIRELLQECADENRLKKSMQSFAQKFRMFISFTLDLLEREERVLEPIFQRYFPDDELMKIHLNNCCPVKLTASTIF